MKVAETRSTYTSLFAVRWSLGDCRPRLSHVSSGCLSCAHGFGYCLAFVSVILDRCSKPWSKDEVDRESNFWALFGRLFLGCGRGHAMRRMARSSSWAGLIEDYHDCGPWAWSGAVAIMKCSVLVSILVNSA